MGPMDPEDEEMYAPAEPQPANALAVAPAAPEPEEEVHAMREG